MLEPSTEGDLRSYGDSSHLLMVVITLHKLVLPGAELSKGEFGFPVWS